MGDPSMQERFVVIVAAATGAELDYWEQVVGRPLTDEDIEWNNLAFQHIGQGVPAPEYLAAEVALQRWCRRVVEWWHPVDGSAGFDVLVTPTLNGPPPPIGYLSERDTATERLLTMLQYTAQFNITGQPAISLPLHWTAGGLPVGVQFVGGFAAEDVIIRLAAQLEAAQPWADRHPPVHA
jgi:amidase